MSGFLKGKPGCAEAGYFLIGAIAATQAATLEAWSALAFAGARRFGYPRLASALVLFAMLFLVITSFIPGLPHHIDRYNAHRHRYSRTFAVEFPRAISPAYPAIEFMNMETGDSATPDVILLATSTWQGLLLGLAILIGRKVTHRPS